MAGFEPAPVLPVRFSKPLRSRFRTHLHAWCGRVDSNHHCRGSQPRCSAVAIRPQFWSARRDSNPQGFHPLRSERSAYTCSATRGNLEAGRRIELRVNRFAGGAVSVSLPSSIWWIEQDLNLQALQEQPGYSRLVSPITTQPRNLVGRGRFELPCRSSAF